LPETEYFDCELPRNRQLMEDPQGFLDSLGSKRVVLDEVHRLPNPSELLKIAADHYPQLRLIATGSSTLDATQKFRDALTGRKAELWLTPAISEDLKTLPAAGLKERLHRGGLPPFLLAESTPENEFQEWMDAYWAKDVLELFRLERRHSFLRFVELLLASSGGIFEATRFARPCEVSRQTIANYLAVLETTFIAHVVRPYSTGKTSEIVAAPKVYGFDTGFVCYFRGWDKLRTDDLGLLWEHYVLNELQAQLQSRRINYWRDKQGHEVDFVLSQRGKPLTAIECKWTATDFVATGFKAFSNRYPDADCLLVAQDVERTHQKRYGEQIVTVTNLQGLVRSLVRSGER
jgi:predicted AAA+ superfamily ATPase